MTAINIFCRRDRIFILTDGAGYGWDGVLKFKVQKVYAFAQLRAAIALRGPESFGALLAHDLSVGALDFDHLVDIAPRVVEQTFEIFKAAAPGIDHDFDCFIAGWSEERGPTSLVLSNHERNGFRPWQMTVAEPWVCAPFDEAIKADIDRAFPKGIGPEIIFDPVVDGALILEMQRRPVTYGQKNLVTVGAFAQLTEITVDAISTRIIHRWPEDEIGKPIGSAPDV